MKRIGRALPSASLLLIALIAVILLAVRFAPAPHPHRTDQIPGLTYGLRAHARAPLSLVVTSVEDEGPAAAAGIAAGDVIDRIDGRPITAPSQVGAAVGRDRARGVLLHVRHRGVSVYKRLPATRT